MSILDNLAARLGYHKAQGGDPKPPGEMLAVADGYHWGVPDASEHERQMRLYAALTWINTAIDIPAGMAADGEYHVKRIAGEPDGPDDEEQVNHPFEQLLYRPNPSASRGEFMRDCYTNFKVTGNLYLFVNALSEGAPPDELWIVPSHLIRPIPDGRSYVAGYEFTPPGRAAEFVEPWKIVHMKTSNPANPFIGLSAIQSLALDAYGDIAQQKWALGFFDKNNAKLPSILAFKQMVGDPEWNKIKAERDREWGGTNRSGVTLLRGVGDALQLIQASSTQKDMEFLAARNFTKEEIYGKLAPGLASILAVNATEANAIAGKATLIEFAIWPFMVQLAEKLSAQLLPLYGDNLRGEFEDMRMSNRILDLQEQDQYAKYHTINEVRVEYYDEGPLELDPEIVAQMEAEEQEKQDNLEKLPAAMQAQAGQPAGKATPSRLDPRGFLFPAQIGPNTPAPGEKKPAPMAPFGAGQAMAQQPPPPPQAEDDTLPGDVEKLDEQASEQVAQQAEMKAWENFALKRLGKPGAREFEPRAIDLLSAMRIKSALGRAKTADDIRAVFALERGGEPLIERAVSALERYASSK
ncbi:MAG: phage portal protein [Candidatus Peribacteraceae bacterium]|nr:phage portal protein [Candidatus Peribacteraceae bacterium]